MKKRVAIVGSAFRFPSTDAGHYWDDLLAGKDLVSEVPADRWSRDAYLHPSKNHPGTSYTFAAGSLGDISRFDAGFFGISPREAAQMDPQQRLLLELSWESFESAGIPPARLRGTPCGVFIGIASADYSYRMADDLSAIDSGVATGNTASIAANRLSYFFDLQGPSMAIDTACSSSLVAFHQACRAIVTGEISHALAGGISLHLHPYSFIIFSKASMLSRKGHCQVFDAGGDGYVRSEGGGVFLLKDYDLALADGDRILAVVAHTAVNTDGHKTGLTVPKAAAQAALLEAAYANAGIAPDEIDYIESHGTGTAVGDPIETRALGEALGQRRRRDNPLPIGSVKSNLGHLEPASGIAGMVKAIHSLRHRIVPATIGVKTVNPKIEVADWNLDLVTENRPLRPEGRLIVGVNSFGFGGANAHVILESAPQPPMRAAPQRHAPAALPFVLSAASKRSLAGNAGQLADWLSSAGGDHPFYDIAAHQWNRRDWLAQRLLFWAADHGDLAAQLRAFADTDQDAGAVAALENARGPVFVYSGNGSQWRGMGRQLLDHPVFRAAVEEVDTHFLPLAGYALCDELAGGNDVRGCSEGKNGRYEYTEIAQPALFALQVGVTAMLRERGLRPQAVTGHSVGEVAAAWASGALTLPQAVQVIYHRSRHQGLTKGAGQMTAVSLSAADGLALIEANALGERVCIAGINSSKGITLAGEPDALAILERQLAEKGVFHRRLDLDYAFHSPAMDGIEAGIREALSDLQPGEGRLPFFSTVTGGLLDGRQLDAAYWWHNIRKPVLFADACNSLLDVGFNLFVEVGPHAVLRSYLGDALKSRSVTGRVLTTLARQDDAPQRVADAFFQVLLAGGEVDAGQYFPVAGRFVELPHYVWHKESLLLGQTPESLGTLSRHMEHPLLGYRLRHGWCWENQIDPHLQPTLGEHVVGEAMVFPGTGYAELALAVAHAWQAGEVLDVEELEIRAPLLLNAEHSKVLRTALDPADGRITISSRQHMADEPWTLHATARVLSEAGPARLTRSQPALPQRAPDFDTAWHETLTRAVGLDYGPAFQAIGQGWVDGDTALALYAIPPAVRSELPQHLLHPALLDCAFQLLIEVLRDECDARRGIAFVPVRMGRINLAAGRGTPHSAQMRLKRRSPHSLLADFSVFAANGEVLAEISDARFKSLRLARQASDPVRRLNWQVIPQPLPDGGEKAVLPYAAAQAAVHDVVRRCNVKGTHRRYGEEIDPLLDALCSRYTAECLTELGRDAGSLDAALAALRAQAPAQATYLDTLLERAQADGVLTLAGGIAAVQPLSDDEAAAADIWNTLIGDYPDTCQIIHACGRIGLALPALLRAEKRVHEARSRDLSPALLLRQVLGERARHALATALGELLAQQLACLPAGRRLAVCEIGAGDPLVMHALAHRLDPNVADLTLIGIEPQAEAVRALIDKAPTIRWLAMADAALPENLSPCDLAVVSLDFATADQGGGAIAAAVRRLRPGGTLVVLGLHPTRWVDFLCGPDPDWWQVNATGQARSQQRSAASWQALLAEYGVAAGERFEFIPDTVAGPYLLLGRASQALVLPQAATKPRSWLLLADAQGVSATLAARLAKALQERGDLAVTCPPGEVHTLKMQLEEMQRHYGKLDGVVHLAGLAAPETGDPLAQPLCRASLALALLQASEQAKVEAPICLVTTGAHPGRLPAAAGSPESLTPSALADAALWGLGRSMQNEREGLAVHLIDLAQPGSAAAGNWLARELHAASDESEVLLDGEGRRHVFRLALAETGGTCDTPAESDFRLGFELPGQLRNLLWQPVQKTAPGRDEIEVEVAATGLNFRDVMYALGLLSDEAIENGFAGPTLGLEFAGRVSAVGAAVAHYAVGDLVVGFGPASFSNRVITRESAIAHIPSGISFEAAATIPSTFFTAYYALHYLARLAPGERVLIHGAAGGVGIAAIQIAKWCGAEIFATAGSDEKRDFLRLLGVEHILDSRSLAYADEILALTAGQGVDVVLNSLAGEAINRNFRILRPFGRFLELGKRDFYENTQIGLRPFRNNITYYGIDADQLMVERPDLTRRLFADMMALFAEGVLHPLPYHAFEAEAIVDAFRYMQQARQIGKIVVTYHNGIGVQAPVKAVEACLQLSSQASYLVTGGLGGFGLRTARWLVEKGARHLILLSRSGPVSEEAKTALAEFESQGVRVLARSCDVSRREALAEVLAEAQVALPPLRGLVHAAVVIDDGMLRSMDAAQLQRTFAAKIAGAFHLHQLTADAALDFFVLYSSATTLFGNPGQGNYVGANYWLEALAHARHAQGLPATVALWGAIDDAGFLARNTKIRDALQGRMGGAALSAATALRHLERMLLSKVVDEAVLELDWRALSRFLPAAASPKFHNMALHARDLAADDDDTADFARLLAELPDKDLLPLIAGMLKEEVGEILRVAPEKIDADQSIYDLGLDSLMGVELVMALENRFGTRLPVMALSESPTIEKLAQRLLRQLRGQEESAAGESAVEQIQHLSAVHGSGLSAEEISSFAQEISNDPTGRMIKS